MRAADQGAIEGAMDQRTIEGAVDEGVIERATDGASDGSWSNRRSD